MMATTTSITLGSANLSHRQVGSVSGLADSQVREAGSDLHGKSCKHLTKFRAATWNIGTLKRRSAEVVETLTRRGVDLCGVQEHRWAGSLSANQTRLINGKDSKYKFYWSANDKGQGRAGILLAEKWVDKVFDVQRFLDRIINVRSRVRVNGQYSEAGLFFLV